MARHQSAIRQHRRSVRRAAVNKRNKTVLRTRIKELRTNIRAREKEAAEKALPHIQSVVDKAAKKGVIHKRKAARLKSRLSRQIRSITSAPTS